MINKPKKILKLAVLCLVTATGANASSYTGYKSDKAYNGNSSVNVYESGFFHGINCVERELKLQGKSGSIIHFKRYMVAMNIASMPKERILIFKNYGYEEGLIPITVSTGQLVFKSFDRQADAKYLAHNILNSKFFRGDNKAVVLHNTQPNGYRRADFIYKDLLLKMRESVERSVQGRVFIPEGVDKLLYKPKTKSVKPKKKKKYYKPKKKVYKKKKVQDKNYSSSYMYPNNKPKKKVEKKKPVKPKKYFTVNSDKAECFLYENKEFKKAGYVTKNTEYVYTGSLKVDGVTYLRFKNRYVEIEDVSVHKK